MKKSFLTTFSSIVDPIKKRWKGLEIQTQQRIMLVSVMGAGGGILVWAMMGFLNTSSGSLKTTGVSDASSSKPLNLQTPSDTMDPNMTWRLAMEEENQRLKEELSSLKKGLAQGPSEDEKTKERERGKALEDLRLEIDVMKSQLIQGSDTSSSYILKEKSGSEETPPTPVPTCALAASTPSQAAFSPSSAPSFPFSSSSSMDMSHEPPVMGVTKLVLEDSSSQKLTQSVDTHVPAGTFARAVILGGVDASTAVQSASDPRPVLLRVIDKGTLPRKFHSDLSDVHILASAYGDLSSERVMMRLEKLTLVETLSGEITEVSVKGYIAGEDGKAGVRGVVVDRATPQIRNAFLGGLVGGIGSFFSKSLSSGQTTISPFGVTSQSKWSTSDMMKAGAGEGLSSAFGKLADFYIKRAEQMQPVIQVAAGRAVDIVITQGISLQGPYARHAKASHNDRARHKAVEEVYSHTSLPFSPVQKRGDS